MADQTPIVVKILKSDNLITLESQEDKIQIWIDDCSRANSLRSDFAAWIFLPIAMRTGRDLHIEGCGSEATVRNARRMSEIWESWIPYHFNTIDVKFKNISETPPEKENRPSLCFYSGGIDSTHAILQRHLDGKKQALLTVHGMDYKAEDASKFVSAP